MLNLHTLRESTGMISAATSVDAGFRAVALAAQNNKYSIVG